MDGNATTTRRERRRQRQTSKRRARTIAAVVGIVVVVAVAGYAVVWMVVQPDGADGVALEVRDDPTPSWDSAVPVLDQSTSGDESTGDDTTDTVPMDEVLSGPLSDPGLGGRVGMTVIDLASGEEVFARDDTVAQMPASTTKLLTTTAAIAELGPGHTFTTTVTASEPLADGVTLTLVGGGDPLLGVGDGANVTPLADLAQSTADALDEAGVTNVELAYDESLFTGPAEDPDWEPGYVSGDVVAPTSALMVDGGRVDPEGDDRAADPAAAAAERFAELLDGAGTEVSGVSTAGQPAGETAGESAEEQTTGAATEVAAIQSAPLSTVVEHTLDVSDNDASEVLMRHVALARDRPATSDDGSVAILAALGDVGVAVDDVTLADGSGLSRANAIPAGVVADVLATASSPDQPELRAVVTGLPVAGFTGTLTERWGDAPGDGLVRAKTGTLTGASALAGVVETASGDSLAFAILADDIENTLIARAALDQVAGALSTCGCVLP